MSVSMGIHAQLPISVSKGLFSSDATIILTVYYFSIDYFTRLLKKIIYHLKKFFFYKDLTF